MIKTIIHIAIFSLLSSCGFKAAYSTNDGKLNNLLTGIEVQSINTIEGADFYNHITNLISSGEEVKFILKTNLAFDSTNTIIQRNSDVLRENLTLKVNYHLIEKLTDRVVTSGNFMRVSSYSTTFSSYANMQQSRTTTRDLAITAAEEIRNRLILFFAGTAR